MALSMLNAYYSKELFDKLYISADISYQETLKGNTKFINKTFDENHNELTGPFNKNKEDVLGRYSGDVMLVGIAYDSKSLKHTSKIELLKIND